MPTETGTQLVRYASQNVGDALRTVAVLYDDSCEVLYLRDDLQETYTPTKYKAVATAYRNEMGIGVEAHKEGPVGDKQCLIHHHERAFVFQFPHEGCHSILMSVEQEVGTQLQSFIDACSRRL